MAQWKKVIVSGSVAELNTVSASLAVVVGADGYNKIGINQATTTLSGSFTGSFVGEGSGLTGLVSSLNISGSDASTGTVQLKTQDLTITGASNEINTTVSGQTVTIGLVDNPTITGDITIGGNTISSSTDTAIELSGTNVEVRGDLQVTGNDIKSSTGATNITLTADTLTTFAGDIKVVGNDISSSTATALTLDGENVKVVGDLTILLNSGSTNPDEAGLVVDEGSGVGHAFAFDAGTLRWGFSGSFDSTATSFVPDAYVAAVVTTDIPAYQQVGNIRIEGGEIYFYV